MALARRTPLKRKTPLRARGNTKYRRRERDIPYMKWVRRQPCSAKVHGGTCGGHVEADHAGRRGIGQKADDKTCIALCHSHHVWRTNFAGPFKDWTKMQMRNWLEAEILRHNLAYRRMNG